MKISLTVQSKGESIGLDFIHAFIASTSKYYYSITVYMPFVKYCYQGSIIYNMYKDDEYIDNEIVKPEGKHGCKYTVIEDHTLEENIVIEIETGRHDQAQAILNLLSIDKFNLYLQ